MSQDEGTPPPPSTSVEAELEAMKTIDQLLQRFTDEGAARILRWAQHRIAERINAAFRAVQPTLNDETIEDSPDGTIPFRRPTR